MEADPFILKIMLGSVPYWVDLREVQANDNQMKVLEKEYWDQLLFGWPWGTDTDIEAKE